MGPGHADIPGNKHADSFPKTRASQPTAMVFVPLPSKRQKPFT